MRYLIAIVLIVCGTLLAMAPTASEYLQGEQISQMLAERADSVGTPFFRQPLDEEYRVGGWLLGGAMICLGAMQGCRSTMSGQDRQDHGSLQIPA